MKYPTRYREANGDTYEAVLVDAAVNVVVEFVCPTPTPASMSFGT